MSIHKVTYHIKEKYLLLGGIFKGIPEVPLVFAGGGGD
jgi:hypothetical protein